MPDTRFFKHRPDFRAFSWILLGCGLLLLTRCGGDAPATSAVQPTTPTRAPERAAPTPSPSASMDNAVPPPKDTALAAATKTDVKSAAAPPISEKKAASPPKSAPPAEKNSPAPVSDKKAKTRRPTAVPPTSEVPADEAPAAEVWAYNAADFEPNATFEALMLGGDPQQRLLSPGNGSLFLAQPRGGYRVYLSASLLVKKNDRIALFPNDARDFEAEKPYWRHVFNSDFEGTWQQSVLLNARPGLYYVVLHTEGRSLVLGKFVLNM